MNDQQNQYFGRYQIIEMLGSGGMGTVYKAYDPRLDRMVAVKVINLVSSTQTNILIRFETEAKALAQLTHPNIVPVIDYGEENGTPYLVMPLLSGGTLKEKMDLPIPYPEAAKLLAPVARALAYAHEHGVLHRDVKPANILITESGQPMLSDFGLVKMVFPEEQKMALTSTGMTIGSPEYIAPEQWKARTVPQSDIYSLGVVFFEMVTGFKPYTADTPADIILKQENESLPRPKSYIPNLPDGIEWIIFKAMAKRPEDRFVSMEDLAGILEKAVDPANFPVITHEDVHVENVSNSSSTFQNSVLTDTSNMSGGSKKPKRNWLVTILVSMIMVCSLTAAGWFGWQYFLLKQQMVDISLAAVKMESPDLGTAVAETLGAIDSFDAAMTMETVSPKVTASSIPQFYDDFEDGFDPQWRGQTANWITSDGMALANECGRIMVGDKSWDNYSLYVEVVGQPHSEVNIIVAQTDDKRLDLALKAANNYTYLFKVIGQDEIEISNSGKQLEMSDGINTILFEIRGTSLRMLLNEVEVYNMTFPDSLAGSVGLESCGDRVPFDNFRITPLE